MLPMEFQSVPFEPPNGWPALLQAAASQPFAAIFDSALPGEMATQSFVSFAPVMLLQCTGHDAVWQRGRHGSRLEGSPLEVFERVESFARQECPLRRPVDAPGFIGGWAGLLGYDLRCFIEKLAPPKPKGPHFPDLQAGFYPWTICLDHATGSCELRLLSGAPGGPGDIQRLGADLAELLARPSAEAAVALGEHAFSTNRKDWIGSVEEVRRRIFEGDIYQANLTRMVHREGRVNAPALYMCLREANPAPFGGFLDCGEGRAILSSSPERFISVRDGVIETRPIKGTRGRGTNEADDSRLREELLASVKDRAELTMIVDLERNDLGRVCKPGSVCVPSLMHVETYTSVHHLEATVRGELRDDVSSAEFIRATFPGGSISGAPKKRALEIIHELEPVRRGPYTGSMFWLTPDGRFESNILIRTLLSEPTGLSYHVGCGIVSDSDPAQEWQESLDKAAALEAAIEKYAERA
ncbi:MAG: anthranilate synthase component I family protein [Planctomycetes bacterium]|nr:anthranilate synthase component I family protein [Planctomycetota bacterium]